MDFVNHNNHASYTENVLILHFFAGQTPAFKCSKADLKRHMGDSSTATYTTATWAKSVGSACSWAWSVLITALQEEPWQDMQVDGTKLEGQTIGAETKVASKSRDIHWVYLSLLEQVKT